MCDHTHTRHETWVSPINSRHLTSKHVILHPGESKQGLLLFGAPRPQVRKVTLRISFALADRAQERLQCFFPFTVEAIPPKATPLPPPEHTGSEPASPPN